METGTPFASSVDDGLMEKNFCRRRRRWRDAGRYDAIWDTRAPVIGYFTDTKNCIKVHFFGFANS